MTNQTKKYLPFIIISGLLFIHFLGFSINYLSAKVAAPTIKVTVTPSNKEKAWKSPYSGGILYPKLSGSEENTSINLATYFDTICVEIDKNPDGTEQYANFSLTVNGKETKETKYCGTWQELISSVGRNSEWSTDGTESGEHGLFSQKYTSTRYLDIIAKNRSGTTHKKITADWIDGCSSFDLNYDAANKYTVCDERAEVNYEHVHKKHSDGYTKYYKKDTTDQTSSSSSNSAPSNSSNSSHNHNHSPTPDTTKQKTSQGLSYKTALNACKRRTESKGYRFDQDLSAKVSGNTWKFEIVAYHDDYYITELSIECHVSGTEKAPTITKYTMDEYKDYYYNDHGDLEECWYGYDEASGKCR